MSQDVLFIKEKEPKSIGFSMNSHVNGTIVNVLESVLIVKTK